MKIQSDGLVLVVDDIVENRALANAFLKKLGWNTDHYSYMVGGQFGNDYYWVFVEGSPATALPGQL